MGYDAELAGRIRDLLEGEPGVTEKAMFGGLAFLVDGHMALAASSKGAVMLRASHEAQERWLGEDGVGPVEMRGRIMRGWLHLPVEAVAGDEALEEVVRSGVAHARTLPPKR